MFAMKGEDTDTYIVTSGRRSTFSPSSSSMTAQTLWQLLSRNVLIRLRGLRFN